jgi:outer membrane protein assembly factor BamB
MWRAGVGCLLALMAAGCAATPSADASGAGAATAQPPRHPREPREPRGPRTPGAAPASGTDWTRFGWDPARSSVSTAPTGITATTVASLRRQQVSIEGIVDGSTIYLSNVAIAGGSHDAFFATTTYGRTIALDADDGAVLWTYTPPGFTSWVGSAQITTATPVADPDRRYIYAASPDGRIQKLGVEDGQAAWRTVITMLPAREKIASALNFFNGRVVAVTGGYIGDAPPYQGHVVLIDGATGRVEQVWNSLCSDRPGLLDPRSCPESDSAIWGRAGAVIDPDTGNIFVATGNARWDGRTFWGDATLVLDPTAARLLGSYTPSNTDDLNSRDLDLGSTSPALLGGGFLLQGGKDGALRLLSLDEMRTGATRRGGERQVVSTPSGGDLFTAPAVMKSDAATWIFAADNGATAAWTFADGVLRQRWRSPRGGTSPVVAGGLLFVYDPRGGLHVYQPDTGALVATLACGAGHWNSPIVIDGRIALPEGNANSHQVTGVLNIWR